MSNSGNWKNPNFPKDGWRYEGWGYYPLQDFKCQACQNVWCKHVRFIWHEDKKISCGVGGICAKNLVNPQDYKQSAMEIKTAHRLWGRGKAIEMRTPEDRQRYREALEEERAREARTLFAYSGRWDYNPRTDTWTQDRANVSVRVAKFDWEDRPAEYFVWGALPQQDCFDMNFDRPFSTLNEAMLAAYDVFLEYFEKAKERGYRPGRRPLPVREEPEDRLRFYVSASEGDLLWRTFKR